MWQIAILRDPIQFLFPSFGKLPASWFAYRRKAVKASDQLRQLLTEIIEKRKKEVLQLRQQGEDVDSHSKDLLTMLIEANLNDEDEKIFMTDSELISNLSIFYAAGHEVCLTTITQDCLLSLAFIKCLAIRQLPMPSHPCCII